MYLFKIYLDQSVLKERGNCFDQWNFIKQNCIYGKQLGITEIK